MRSSTLPLRIVSLTAVVLSVAFCAAAEGLGLGGGISVVEASARHHGVLTPASYTHAVGWVIGVSLIALCAAALRRPARALLGLDLVCVNLVVAALLVPAWLVLYRHEHMGLALVVLFAIEAAALSLYLLSNELVAEGASRWWLVPASLLAGMATVSCVGSAVNLLEAHGWLDGHLGSDPWAIAALVGISAFAIAVAARFRDFVFPAIIAWGQLGVGAEAEDLRNRVAFAAYLCSGLTAIAVVLVVAVVATELLAEETRRLELRPPGPGRRAWSAS